MKKKISAKVLKAISEDEKKALKKKQIKMLDSVEPNNKTDKGKASSSTLNSTSTSKKRAVKYSSVHDDDDDDEDEYDDDDDDEAVIAIEESEEDDEDEEVATKKPNTKQRKRTHSIKKEAGSKQKRRKLSVNEEDIALDYMEKFKQIYENRFNNSIKNLSQDISFINKVKFALFLYLQ